MQRRHWNFRKWCDEFVLAAKGILLAMREPRFWCGFVPAFIFFSMLMNLLSGGTTKFELMVATGWSGALEILGSAFLAVFGVNQIFSDWIFIFLIALLQGILIGLIVLLWKKKKQSAKNVAKNGAKVETKVEAKDETKGAKEKTKTAENAKETKDEKETKSQNSENLQKAGLITGLIALGAGCPTCGVTLLTPLLGAIFSTGSLAIAGVISGVVTVLALIIAVLSLKSLGVETYVTIIN